MEDIVALIDARERRAEEARTLQKGTSMIFWINVASAIFAAAAGVLWLLSALVKLPSKFPLLIITSHFADAEFPADGKIQGTAESEDIDNLGKAMLKQSRLSACAAFCACAAAICQAVVIIFPKISN